MQARPREIAFQNYDRECWVCGADDVSIEVHHIRRYLERGPEDLVPLCRLCHAAVHSTEPQNGLLRKLQALNLRYKREHERNRSDPDVTVDGDFVFEDGDLRYID